MTLQDLVSALTQATASSKPLINPAVRGGVSTIPDSTPLPTPTLHERQMKNPVYRTVYNWQNPPPLINPVVPTTPTPTPTPTPIPTPSPALVAKARVATIPSIGVYQGVNNSQFPYVQTRQVPAEYAPIILQASQKYGVDPNLLAAVLIQESQFNPRAVNPGSGDYGMAQINLKSHPGVTKEQAFDPNFAIPFAAQLVKGGLDKFGGDYNRAIASYNVGKGGASVQGPEAFGGGPRGQFYLDNVIRNVDPNYVAQLKLKPSPDLRQEYIKSGRAKPEIFNY